MPTLLLTAFLLLNDTASVQGPLTLDQRFTPSGELVLPGMIREGKRLSLIISPDGSFRLGAP